MPTRVKRITTDGTDPIQQIINVDGRDYVLGVNESKVLPDEVAAALLTPAESYSAQDRVRRDTDPGEATS